MGIVKNFLYIYGMETMKYSSCNRISEALAKKRKTAYWLSKVTGYSTSQISRWVANQKQPSLCQLFEIAAALKVEAKTLILPNQKVFEGEMRPRIEEIRDAVAAYRPSRGLRKTD